MYLIFTLVRDIQILPLTKKEFENLFTKIPKIAEVTVQSLSTKLKNINKNYPYTIPDRLKIMLTVTSTVTIIIVVAIIIYLKKSGNCLVRKHLWNNKKNEKTTSNEFELREITKSYNISMSHLLSCRSTTNSCHSLAQRQLPQLPNSCDQPDSPFYNIVQ